MTTAPPCFLGYAVLLRRWGKSFSELVATFDGDKLAPAAPEAGRQQAFLSRSLGDTPVYIQGDAPGWLQSSFKTAFGKSCFAEAQELNGRPYPRSERNTMKVTHSKVLKAFEESGAGATRIASRQGIHIPAGKALFTYRM